MTEAEARAYEWIKTMTQSAERFAGSSAERRVGEWMRGVGAREVVLEPAGHHRQPAAVAMAALAQGAIPAAQTTAA